MRALVTGAAGFLGREIVRQLLRGGFDVRCGVRSLERAEGLTKTIPAADRGRVEIRALSLERTDSCVGAGDGCDVVVHAAAGMSGGGSSLFLNSVVGTRNLIRALHSADVRLVVLVSSIAVYGAPRSSRRPIDEESPLDPHPELRDLYSYSKIAQEQAADEECGRLGVPCAKVRPGVIYGPGRGYLSNRVGLQLGGTLIQFGGSQPLPYVFVDNCAQAIVRSCSQDGVAGRSFNLLDDELPTGRQLVRRYRLDGGKLRVIRLPRWSLPWLSRLYETLYRHGRGMLPPALVRYRTRAMWGGFEYSNEQAREVLGWRPLVPLQEALESTSTWLRADLAAKSQGAGGRT